MMWEDLKKVWCRWAHKRHHECFDDLCTEGKGGTYSDFHSLRPPTLPGPKCYGCHSCGRLWTEANLDTYASDCPPSFVYREFISDGTFRKGESR